MNLVGLKRPCDVRRSSIESTSATIRKPTRHLVQWVVCSLMLLCGRELFAAETSSPTPFIVTAYCQQGITKTGIPAAPGVAAADPDYVPLGSVVDIATGSPTDPSRYTVVDTGAKVKGRHLDVFTPDCSRAKQFGRRLLQVTILRFGWHGEPMTRRGLSSRNKP